MTNLTLYAEQALLANGWRENVRLAVADGRIASIEIGATPQPSDTQHKAVLPGMPNLHSHAFQRIMAGRSERRGASEDSFWSWRDLMYRTALALEPDEVEAIAAQAYVEMLEAGFTRAGEFHYLHHDRDGKPYANIAEMAERIAAAASDTGIGLTLLPVLYAHAGFGGVPPADAQRRFVNSIDAFQRLHDGARLAIARVPGAVLGVAPHSLRAVTPEQLSAAVRIAGAGPIHIHVAEQTKEVDDCVAWWGARPVAWLLGEHSVDSQWCLIHATHMNANEISGLAASGAVAGLCPITEANLGDGIFSAAEFGAAGGRFGIGSDQNVEIGVAAELRMLEYGQRLRLRARNVLAAPDGSTGRALFERALMGGAQALGCAKQGLRVGAPADLVTLQPRHPSWPLGTANAILDGWIFSGLAAIDCVYVRGLQLVADGMHVRRDAIAKKFGVVLRRHTIA